MTVTFHPYQASLVLSNPQLVVGTVQQSVSQQLNRIKLHRSRVRTSNNSNAPHLQRHRITLLTSSMVNARIPSPQIVVAGAEVEMSRFHHSTIKALETLRGRPTV